MAWWLCCHKSPFLSYSMLASSWNHVEVFFVSIWKCGISTCWGIHFCPFSKTISLVLSLRVWKKSSVSIPVPSSSSTRPAMHDTLNASIVWGSKCKRVSSQRTWLRHVGVDKSFQWQRFQKTFKEKRHKCMPLPVWSCKPQYRVLPYCLMSLKCLHWSPFTLVNRHDKVAQQHI